MRSSGTVISSHGLDQPGLTGLEHALWNLSDEELYKESLKRGEGVATDKGALAVTTGQHTGRSAQDKYIVRDGETEDAVWWDNNKAMSPEHFSQLQQDFIAHSEGMELFVQDLHGGADARHRIRVRVVAEFAWHTLFIRYLLRRPELAELADFAPELTVINLPSFRADPNRHGCRSETVIAASLSEGLVLIGGTEYAGETKKSVFGALNYFLPAKSVMPMHCSANVGQDGNSALFFGLSGTGKTTLSSDAARTLIGDDEHGWSEDGIFNFEGGCYAKTIRLSEEAEPEIYATTQRWGSILENVVVDPETGVPDFDDGSLTENGRVAYPMHFIPNASETAVGPHPRNVIMLTADAFGVMPPIARLTPSQAMYHFLSGYTAKVAGTEKGVAGTQATFSTCFGAPFMPRHPSVYGNLLRDLIARHGATCWLVNTGWTGGAYGTGSRMPIKATRALLNAALDGKLDDAPMRKDPFFGFEVPLELDGVDSGLLSPRDTWADGGAYDEQAAKLVAMFQDNFRKFEAYVDPEVNATAPSAA
ncbi:MAG: phosphoenolpyruvate carboxykinase [Pseudomonadota bacterium]